MQPQRIILGISGASGIVYGVEILKLLLKAGIETHLVVSRYAELTAQQEYPGDFKAVKALATHCYAPMDMSAAIASGSFLVDGMIVAPCSVRSLAEIATGLTTQLLTRAADVMLKDRRRLVLMVRETPLSLTHLNNMVAVTQAGGIIAPPMPAFYAKPKDLNQMVSHAAGRVLDLFGIQHDALKRWGAQHEMASA